MKDVKLEQVNEVGGGAIAQTVGDVLAGGIWQGNLGANPPFNPDGPGPVPDGQVGL